MLSGERAQQQKQQQQQQKQQQLHQHKFVQKGMVAVGKSAKSSLRWVGVDRLQFRNYARGE